MTALVGLITIRVIRGLGFRGPGPWVFGHHSGRDVDIMKKPWYPVVNVDIWKDPPFLMGKLTISMAMFNGYVELPEDVAVGFDDF